MCNCSPCFFLFFAFFTPLYRVRYLRTIILAARRTPREVARGATSAVCGALFNSHAVLFTQDPSGIVAVVLVVVVILVAVALVIVFVLLITVVFFVVVVTVVQVLYHCSGINASIIVCHVVLRIVSRHRLACFDSYNALKAFGPWIRFSFAFRGVGSNFQWFSSTTASGSKPDCFRARPPRLEPLKRNPGPNLI